MYQGDATQLESACMNRCLEKVTGELLSTEGKSSSVLLFRHPPSVPRKVPLRPFGMQTWSLTKAGMQALSFEWSKSLSWKKFELRFTKKEQVASFDKLGWWVQHLPRGVGAPGKTAFSIEEDSKPHRLPPRRAPQSSSVAASSLPLPVKAAPLCTKDARISGQRVKKRDQESVA